MWALPLLCRNGQRAPSRGLSCSWEGEAALLPGGELMARRITSAWLGVGPWAPLALGVARGSELMLGSGGAVAAAGRTAGMGCGKSW